MRGTSIRNFRCFTRQLNCILPLCSAEDQSSVTGRSGRIFIKRNYCIYHSVSIVGRFSPFLYATKALRVSRGTAVLFLGPRHSRWGGWSAPRPGRLYPRERPGTHCTGGWVGPRAGLDGRKSRPHRDSIPGRPARSSDAILTELPGQPVSIVRAVKSRQLQRAGYIACTG